MINEGLVSFTIGLAPAACRSGCFRIQEMLVELVALYVVLLILFPNVMFLITGLFVLVAASVF
jgi:hypothetical protein|tara:strand:+ start:448 stop:636 length:189 start_codon:yes stop_codon:yes gene_type:complete